LEIVIRLITLGLLLLFLFSVSCSVPEESLSQETYSVVVWGSNRYGQCNVPEPNSGFVSVDAGFFHVLGLKDDGSIVAWGRNEEGQCDIPEPNEGFIAVSAGLYQSLGLRENGSIEVWGDP
jgi:hypothetical protein